MAILIVFIIILRCVTLSNSDLGVNSNNDNFFRVGLNSSSKLIYAYDQRFTNLMLA